MHGEEHGLEAQALLEHLLHVLAVILVFLDALAVRVEVGVARDADYRAILRDIGAKTRFQARQDDILEQDVAQLAVVSRDLDDAGERAWDLDDAEEPLFVFGGGGERADDVEGSVAQVGEGVARVDDERREDGEHVAVEVAAHRIALGTYELGGRDALDALGAQEGFDGVEGRGGFGEQSRQRREYGRHLLGGGHAALVVAWLPLEGRQA